MAKVLMKGNEALCAAAIKAGCRYFFGYPITPQNEVPEYMSRELPKVGGCFVQAESEVAAINMVYGAAGSGARVMTSSSSPGIALKQEGISYIAGAELPCLIVNIMRSGPGLGGIQPGQADYYQVTRGGGNGDYNYPVYAPYSIQEMADLTIKAFHVADKYRTPVMICGDGMLGQMMEAVEFPEEEVTELPEKPWAATGTQGKRKPNVINSLDIVPESLERHCRDLDAKWQEIRKNECRVEILDVDKADVVVTAYGTVARIAMNAKKILAKEGITLGIIRPITIWPYPYHAFDEIGKDCQAVLCVEMSMGQMLDDVKIGVNGRHPVHFYGRTGGVVPLQEEIVDEVKKILGGAK
ncbi:MAG: 3-methyl-2-oxobutanoate dehydrogenase subunit VorB [Spirochaetales bacterium]|nr:3-methyl-2-oxobutanoate dehydrogenase subunit VorB [Spirochaetales bacterium]